jgi:hypothetical protein
MLHNCLSSSSHTCTARRYSMHVGLVAHLAAVPHPCYQLLQFSHAQVRLHEDHSPAGSTHPNNNTRQSRSVKGRLGSHRLISYHVSSRQVTHCHDTKPVTSASWQLVAALSTQPPSRMLPFFMKGKGENVPPHDASPSLDVILRPGWRSHAWTGSPVLHMQSVNPGPHQLPTCVM